MELIGDLLPAGVLNVVNGFGVEAGKPLASNKRIRKIAFTGETTTGRLIMQYASENLIPVTLELGGKSPNIFFEDIAAKDDAFYDKAQEGFTMFALNQGEVCTCPSRALVQDSIYDKFLPDVIKRTKAIKQGNPLDTDTMIGAQASNDQLEKILSYLDIGKAEGAKVLTGGGRAELGGDLEGGYYVQPTIFEGHNKMRIFQEEIFGPVVSVARFTDYDHAIEIANDTLYGLGSGVWSRNGNTAYRAGRDIQAGRVWVNQYHAYPAHSAFGGYKSSGIGRENHKMMLDHYQQTKNLLVSYRKTSSASSKPRFSPGRRPTTSSLSRLRPGEQSTFHANPSPSTPGAPPAQRRFPWRARNDNDSSKGTSLWAPCEQPSSTRSAKTWKSAPCRSRSRAPARRWSRSSPPASATPTCTPRTATGRSSRSLR